jgi:hypothetical protein
MGLVRVKHSRDHSVPEECLISRTVREIRTAREKELSLFVSRTPAQATPVITGDCEFIRNFANSCLIIRSVTTVCNARIEFPG